MCVWLYIYVCVCVCARVCVGLYPLACCKCIFFFSIYACVSDYGKVSGLPWTATKYERSKCITTYQSSWLFEEEPSKMHEYLGQHYPARTSRLVYSPPAKTACSCPTTACSTLQGDRRCGNSKGLSTNCWRHKSRFITDLIVAPAERKEERCKSVNTE